MEERAMAAEKIIEKIHTDASKEVDRIKKDAEAQANTFLKEKKETIKQETDALLKKGMQQADLQKKIKISQAYQEAKRTMMQAKETLIEDCFTEAKQQLSTLDETTYDDTIRHLIKQGMDQIGGPCIAHFSRENDKKLIEKANLQLGNKIQASGGVLLVSKDGHITIDNTFEGILARKKNDIRVKVGTLLFSK